MLSYRNFLPMSFWVTFFNTYAHGPNAKILDTAPYFGTTFPASLKTGANLMAVEPNKARYEIVVSHIVCMTLASISPEDFKKLPFMQVPKKRKSLPPTNKSSQCDSKKPLTFAHLKRVQLFCLLQKIWMQVNPLMMTNLLNSLYFIY